MRASILISLFIWASVGLSAVSKRELVSAVEQAHDSALHQLEGARTHGEVDDNFPALFLRALTLQIPDLSVITPKQIRTLAIPEIIKAPYHLNSPWQALFEGWAERAANIVSPRQMNPLLTQLRVHHVPVTRVSTIAGNYLKNRTETVTASMLWKLTDGEPEVLIPYVKERRASFAPGQLYKFRDDMTRIAERKARNSMGTIALFGNWIAIHAGLRSLPKLSMVDTLIDDYLTWRLSRLEVTKDEAERWLIFLSEQKKLPSFREYSVAIERLDGDYNVTIPLNLISPTDYESAFKEKIWVDCPSASRIVASD